MRVDDHCTTGDRNAILNTNGTNITYKIDSGAQVNVLPKKLLNSLRNRPSMKSTTAKLKAYGGSDIPVVGKCVAYLRLKNKSVPVLFIVAETSSSSILGLKTSQSLNLIKRVKEISSSIPTFT